MVTCEICKTQYEPHITKCPSCGLINPKFQPKHCDSCGTVIEPGERFCSGCGKPQLEEKQEFCLSCDAKLKPGATFCTQCGTKVGQRGPATLGGNEVAIDVSEQLPVTTAKQPEPRPVDYQTQRATDGSDGYDRPPASKVAPTLPPLETAAPNRPVQPTSPETVYPPVQPQSDNVEAPWMKSREVAGAVQPQAPQEQTWVQQASGEAGIQADQGFSGAQKEYIPIPAAQPPVYIPPANEGAMSAQDPAHQSQPTDTQSQERTMHDQLFGAENGGVQPVAEQGDQLELQTREKEKPKKKSAGITIVIIILIILILGGLAFLWFKLIPNALGGSPTGLIGKENNQKTTSADSGADIPEEPTVVDEVPEGFTHKVGEEITAQWLEVKAFDDGGVARVKSDAKWGIIDLSGNYITPPTYEYIGEFSDGFALVYDGIKYGYLDSSGVVGIPIEYESASDFSEGTAIVLKDNKIYLLTATGELKDIVPSEAVVVSSFKEGLAGVTTDSESYFIDVTGTKVSENYEEVGDFSEGLARVKVGGAWNYMDADFNLIIKEEEFDEASDFTNGRAIVKIGGKEFLIDTTGERVSPMVDKVWPFHEGVSTVQNTGLYGFVDGTNKEGYLIDPQYVDAYGFSENYAAVSINEGIWYYVDKANSPPFEKTFDEAYQFRDGLANVQIGLKYTMIDSKGNVAVDQQWDETGDYSQSFLPVIKDGVWGFAKIVPAQ